MPDQSWAGSSWSDDSAWAAPHECAPDCAVCAAYARVMHSWVEALAIGVATGDPVGVARRDPRVRRAVRELSAVLATMTGPAMGGPLPPPRLRPRLGESG